MVSGAQSWGRLAPEGAGMGGSVYVWSRTKRRPCKEEHEVLLKIKVAVEAQVTKGVVAAVRKQS